MSRFAGRLRDRIWFTFLIPTTLAVDMQPLYPDGFVAGTPMEALLKWYLVTTRDPILLGVLSGGEAWAWLRTFFYLEGFFQLPCFVLGAIGLWYNDPRVYPLLLAYGASTATTLLPVLNGLLTDTASKPPLSSIELGMLLSSYVPFLVIPLAMAVDMGFRLSSICNASVVRKRV